MFADDLVLTAENPQSLHMNLSYLMFADDLVLTAENPQSLHMNLSYLMFADDLVLTAENPQSLQLQLNVLSNFCDSAQLNVNMIKTKIMQFGSSNRVDYIGI
jgi:P pilus assembly chaperone PapD